MSFVSRSFLKSTGKAGLRVILHILVLDTKTFQQHNWIMLRLKLPLLSPTQAEQALGKHLTEETKKSEKAQRKYTKMKKGNKSNEISAVCSCPYTLFFLAIKKTKDTHCRKKRGEKRLHRECSSLLLRNAVKACQSTDT